MVGPIYTEQREGASVGYRVNYVTLTLASHMTLTFDF